MTDIDLILRKKTNLPVILILIIAATALFSVLDETPSKKHSFWPGYHLLLVSRNNDSSLEYISDLLVGEKIFDEIVSKYNTEIEYSNYNKLEKIRISSLEKRFNQQDPRYDSFMKKVPNYFETESEGVRKDIIYIKTLLTERRTESVLENILPDNTEWEIASVNLKKSVFINSAVFLLIIASLVYVKKMKSAFFFLTAALWTVVILKTDAVFFCIAVINIVFVSYNIEIIELILRNWFDSRKFSIDIIVNRKSIVIGVSVFLFSNLVLAVVNPSIKSFIILYAAVSAESAILFLDLAYSLKKATGYIHRIFSCVPILETNKSRIFDRWLIIKPVYFYLFVLLVSIPSVFFMQGKSTSQIPQPVDIAGKSGIESFADMKTLSEAFPLKKMGEKDSYLPDVSDYFKHLAYQIRMPYESDYSLPEQNESINISHYILNKNNFQEEKKSAYLFTDSWLKDNIIRIKEGGLTGLMLSADNPVKVVFTDTSEIVDPVLFLCIYCIFYIFLILMVVWKEKSGKTNYEKHILPVIKRRKQQAA